MTTAVINKVSTDQVELEFMQFGSSSTQCSIRDDALDGRLDYHFCVNELSVNLRNAPIHPVAQDTVLFQIRKRMVGVGIDTIAPAQDEYAQFLTHDAAYYGTVVGRVLLVGPLPAENLGFAGFLLIQDITGDIYGRVLDEFRDILNPTSTLPPQGVHFTDSDFQFTVSPNRKMFSTSEFIQSLKAWSSRFNQAMTQTGIAHAHYGLTAAQILGANGLPVVVAPVQLVDGNDAPIQGAVVEKYLQFNSTNDGSIEVAGTQHFWDLFTLEFNSYGASLLGVDLAQLIKHDNRYFLGVTGDSFATLFLVLHAGSQEYRYVPPANTAAHTLQTGTPIYQSCDQRVKISVTSHLNILSNIKIENGLQKADRTIGEAFFENKLTSEMERDGATFQTKLTSRIYGGQMNMIRKSDPYHAWHKLLNSFDTKFFRFYVHITYRMFDMATNTWSIQTTLLEVNDDDYWLMQIRFVSDV
jgi:hypothetical protein